MSSFSQNVVRDKQEAKNQLAGIAEITPVPKFFDNSLSVEFRTVKLERFIYNETNNVLVVGNQAHGILGENVLGEFEDAFDGTIHAVLSREDEFQEHFEGFDFINFEETG